VGKHRYGQVKKSGKKRGLSPSVLGDCEHMGGQGRTILKHGGPHQHIVDLGEAFKYECHKKTVVIMGKEGFRKNREPA